MPIEGEGPVEIRLGDLDLKTAGGGKANYWLDLENRLIREGWYRGRGDGQGRLQSRCSLASL